MLHDLGKVGISERILHKKSRLSPEEFEEIKKHPQIGVDIIRPIHSLRSMIPALLHHHERWDRTGYPDGLKRKRIPLEARIIAVADVYQALLSARPYKRLIQKKKP
jgi:HD-GYP domain-containing protein (c-di-GMP phosphodiesterase class II)